jgi:hypothetical protein
MPEQLVGTVEEPGPGSVRGSEAGRSATSRPSS